MTPMSRRVAKNLRRAFGNPGRAAALFWRRVVCPFAIMAKDPEAYTIVGSWTFGSLQRVALTDLFPGAEAVDLNLVRTFG